MVVGFCFFFASRRRHTSCALVTGVQTCALPIWALGGRAPLLLPQGPGQRWSLDFVSDTLADGRRFRILAVVDDYSRECPCLVADTSLSGSRVARELDAVIARRGRRNCASPTTAPS